MFIKILDSGDWSGPDPGVIGVAVFCEIVKINFGIVFLCALRVLCGEKFSDLGGIFAAS
jgi:hypothetical protein